MTRAVWCDIARDFPDRGEIEKFVAWCGRHGIGVCFPCINHATGLVTYPSDVAPRAAAYDDWDPMPDLVRLCGAAGIELHIWVVNAHWGPQRFDGRGRLQPSSRGARPLQEAHRDWFTVNHLGQSVLDEGAAGEAIHGGGFLNLGLPAVQDFQERLFAELLDRYELDGVHLDYIRSNFQREDWVIEVPAGDTVWAAAEPGDIFQLLPRSGAPRKAAPGGFRAVEVVSVEDLPGESGGKPRRRIKLCHAGRYGFNDEMMRRFEAETGIGYFSSGPDTAERTAWLYKRHREDWHTWKRGRITDLVRRLSAVTHSRRRKLSAAVFDSIPWSRQEIAQDWSVWCNEGLLDFVCPMDYGKRAPELAGCIRAQDEHLRQPRLPSLAGILTGCGIIDLSREDLAACEETARSLGQAGVSLYCYGTFRRLLD